MIDSLKYLRSPTLKCKDIWIRKSEFVTNASYLGLLHTTIFILKKHVFAVIVFGEENKKK